ncbi:MAG: stage II sporulation protein M [Lachnospiraceae bacterium]|nr:stage II sporulation protein M [Lachnospiraceae bacterium]
MKAKNSHTRQIILLIICLFFALGVLIGTFCTVKYNINPTTITSPQSIPQALFVFGKFVFVVWLIGFFPFGVFFVPPVAAFCGYTYGISSASFLLSKDFTMFARFSATYLLYTTALMLSACASMHLCFNTYTNCKNAKETLPREKQRILIEYIIILLISVLPLSLGVGLEFFI